jgi:hypothetical protein
VGHEEEVAKENVMEMLTDLLRGFKPEGGTYGDAKWTTVLMGKGTAGAVAGTREQSTKLTVEHRAWVYFADDAPKKAYYVIHHMEVDANANTTGSSPLADESDARGFFNSSARIAYRGGKPAVSQGCTVTKEFTGPRTAKDDFEVVLDRLQIEMIGRAGGGTGSIVFTPSFQARTRVDRWSLSAGDAAWELYQREPWTALGVDGPGGDQRDKTAVPVPDRWIKQFFDGEFGRISEMPAASFAPVTCDLLAVWKVDGTFTKTSRAATLNIGVDYRHRINLFHNGTLGPDNEPRRHCAEINKTDESTELKLHEIAVRRDN